MLHLLKITRISHTARYNGHHNSRNNSYFLSRLNSNMSAHLSSNDDSSRCSTIEQTTNYKKTSQLPKNLRQRRNLSSHILGHTQHLNIMHRTSQLLSLKSSFNRLVCETRHFVHTAPFNDDDENIMEKAVTSLKERKQKKTIERLVDPSTPKEVAPVKPPIMTRIKDALTHYYHGFRLFFLELRVSSRLLTKTLSGKSLSRRELKQFRRTAGDLFRMVPFSVFVVIPFMEFLLPVYLWLFPNALPSTFQSESSKEARKKKQLQVKLQMAKFLQDTIEEMAVKSSNPNKKDSVLEFANFFEKIRKSGEQASTDEIVKFSKLFENELTLDNLSHKQLQALCRIVLLPTIGSSNVLRFQLRMKLRQLEADDKMIRKEGVDTLTVPELQAASQARGMRALGMPVERLKSQLQQWIDLQLNKNIPTSLLLLSRALYLPEDIPTSNILQATLSTLPENIVDEAEVLVASAAGETVDNKRRAEIVRQQETMIKEEEKEKIEETLEEFKKQESTDDISSTSSSVESFSAEEMKDLSHAISSLKKSLNEEKETLKEIQEDREDFCETKVYHRPLQRLFLEMYHLSSMEQLQDIADLEQECKEGDEKLQESIASERLGRRVEAMLSKVEGAINSLEQDYVANGNNGNSLEHLSRHKGGVITLQQLEAAIGALKGTSGEAKYRSLFSVLDEDHDGNIALEEMAEIIEVLANEDTNIHPDHVAQIKSLIQLEEQKSQ